MKAMAQKAREENVRLEKRIAELEAELSRIGEANKPLASWAEGEPDQA